LAELNIPNNVGIFNVIGNGKIKRNFEKCPKCGCEDLIIKQQENLMICIDCDHKESLIFSNQISGVLETTSKIIPESCRVAFICAQHISLQMKDFRSQEIITSFWENFAQINSRGKFLKSLSELLGKIYLFLGIQTQRNILWCKFCERIFASFFQREFWDTFG